MICINLLPFKEIQAKLTRRRELTIVVGVLACAGLILIGLFFHQTYEQSKLNSELTSLRNEIQALNVKVKEVGDLQNKIKELISKNKVIGDLNKKKSGPVGVMESLSTATPSRLWLTEFKEVGGKLTINGLAADNQTVADFLRALAATDYFRNVELVETTQGSQEVGAYKRFSIRTTLFYLPQPAVGNSGASRTVTSKEEKKS